MGQIIRPHGIRGDLAMKVLTAYPERLAEREVLFVGPDYREMHVKRIRYHGTGVLVLFDGVTDREAAELLRDQLVYVHIDDAVPLEEGEYYLYQLYGIAVVTEEGLELGQLTDVLETGANDVYVVTTPEGREVLIPAIPDVIRRVDVHARVMTIRLLEGLL